MKIVKQEKNNKSSKFQGTFDLNQTLNIIQYYNLSLENRTLRISAAEPTKHLFLCP
jgi:hypothetical protein